MNWNELWFHLKPTYHVPAAACPAGAAALHILQLQVWRNRCTQ